MCVSIGISRLLEILGDYKGWLMRICIGVWVGILIK